MMLIASGGVVGGELNYDDPGFKIWMKKLEDLPADKQKEIREFIMAKTQGRK